MPARTLSIASLVAFLATSAILQWSRELRELFLLPVSLLVIFAAGMAGVSWWIALTCRRRPGRPFPRYWAFGLAVGNSGLAVAVLISRAFGASVPVLEAAATAGLAAALVLTPRLLPLGPDSRWLPRIAIISLLGFLVPILALALWLGTRALEARRAQVEVRIGTLRERATSLRELLACDWSKMEEEPPQAERQAAQLVALDFAGLDGDPRIWEAARVFGREGELAAASRALVDELVRGLEPERGPRLSSLENPPIYWDRDLERWVRHAELDRLSGLTIDYYVSVGRLFEQLDPGALEVESPHLAGLQAAYAASREELGKHLEARSQSWSDHWVVALLPERLGGREATLQEVLRMPWDIADPEPLRPSSLWRLMELPLGQARSLAQRAEGCHERRYPEGDDEYLRVDCHAFAAGGERSARLRAEVRIVYADRRGRLDDRDRPRELYFLFPIPSAAEAEEFEQEVMTSLHGAIRQEWDGEVRTNMRGGAIRNGFTLVGDGGGELVVYRPRTVTFITQQGAVQVRAEWSRRPPDLVAAAARPPSVRAATPPTPNLLGR